MKTKILFYIVVPLVILAVMMSLTLSCEDNCFGSKPKNLKPVDWENYNDVATVFYNARMDCEQYHNNTTVWNNNKTVISQIS